MRLLLLGWSLLIGLALIPASGSATPPDSTAFRKFTILPVPTIGYAPETRLYFGAVALMSWRFHNDTLTRPTLPKVEFTYTTNKQIILEAGWQWFGKENKLASTGIVSWRKFPELFYGIGNATADSTEELYDSQSIVLEVAVQRKLGKAIYVGPQFIFHRLFGVEYDPEGQFVNQQFPGKAGGITTGAGVLAAYDTRDRILNPRKGSFLSASALQHSSVLGSDFVFSSLVVDARHYQTLVANHLLALQVRSEFNWGNPGFSELARLGGPSHMRGYYNGRFRDKQYQSAQAEYRSPIWWRLGFTVFGSAGDVSGNLSQLTVGNLKTAYGVGLRFLTDRKEKINLRIDYARGRGGVSGFYIAFGEAF